MKKKTIGAALISLLSPALVQAAECIVHTTEYKGWNAMQMENASVKVTLVPQLGGRVMQVAFLNHEYLFVNSRYEGKYIPPEQAKGKWINYGGDKIWPMPEGSEDEEHWRLESGALDDGLYESKTLEQGQHCAVQLTGPVDTITGLQYMRRISMEANSTAIQFHAVMKNATAHTIRWSMQSVSQYNLASAGGSSKFNRDFWAYTAENPASSYVNNYYVRSGLADDPSFDIKNHLFRLHWMYLANEVWIDSPGSWLAVADGESGFGMVERFHFDPSASYPGKATVIFYKNGPSVDFDKEGNPALSMRDPLLTPYYMEAEVNSPMVSLDAGESYAMDTTWLPLRTQSNIQQVTQAGVVTERLKAVLSNQSLQLTGSFGVVAAGHLEARLIDRDGHDAAHITFAEVGPEGEVKFDQTLKPELKLSRVSLHLVDASGKDYGILDTVDLPATSEDE